MKNQPDILMDESGSLMVMVILLLAVLTILASTGNRGKGAGYSIIKEQNFFPEIASGSLVWFPATGQQRSRRNRSGIEGTR